MTNMNWKESYFVLLFKNELVSVWMLFTYPEVKSIYGMS